MIDRHCIKPLELEQLVRRLEALERQQLVVLERQLALALVLVLVLVLVLKLEQVKSQRFLKKLGIRQRHSLKLNRKNCNQKPYRMSCSLKQYRKNCSLKPCRMSCNLKPCRSLSMSLLESSSMS